MKIGKKGAQSKCRFSELALGDMFRGDAQHADTIYLNSDSGAIDIVTGEAESPEFDDDDLVVVVHGSFIED